MGSRYVDTVPVPEKVRDKKVIILSYSRSGTLGLCKALEMLGYTPYSMPQAMKNGVSHLRMFNEAMKIKRSGRGKPYDRADLDKWLWNYDALSIVPCYLTSEVVAAYPDAKYILTVREPEAWATSVWNTIGALHARMRAFPMSVLRYFDPANYWFSALVGRIFHDILTRGHGRTDAGWRAALEEYRE